jgi:flagellar assembly factor FliW
MSATIERATSAEGREAVEMSASPPAEPAATLSEVSQVSQVSQVSEVSERSERSERSELSTDLPELTFVRPLPGFGQLTRFALVRVDHAGSGDDDPADGGSSGPDEPATAGAEDFAEDSVLFELRCLEAPDVRFLVAAPAAFFPDYAFDLDQDAVDDLALTSADDALVLVVLTVGADAASTTANLLAPVVVNVRTRSAAQVILSGTDWPVRAAVV